MWRCRQAVSPGSGEDDTITPGGGEGDAVPPGGGEGDTSLFRDADEEGQRKRTKTYYTYELRFDNGKAEGMLFPKDKPRGTMEVMKATDPEDLFVARQEVIKAHKGLFGAIYHLSPSLSYGSLDKAKTSAAALATVARMYISMRVVQPRIGFHLSMHLREETLGACARETREMLEFAMAIESPWIFLEASVYLLGSNDEYWQRAQPTLEKLGIQDLMSRKRAEFENTLRRCELAVFCIQPPPPQDTNSLMAVNYLSHYLREHLAMGGGSGLRPGYAIVYRNIAHIMFAGLDRQDLTRYVGQCYVDPEPIYNDVVPAARHLFTQAATVLQPILVDRSKRGPFRGVMYNSNLRFMTVGDDELPWQAEKQ